MALCLVHMSQTPIPNALESNSNRDHVVQKHSWYSLMRLWGKASPGNLPNALSVISIMFQQQEKKMTLCPTVVRDYLTLLPS